MKIYHDLIHYSRLQLCYCGMLVLSQKSDRPKITNLCLPANTLVMVTRLKAMFK